MLQSQVNAAPGRMCEHTAFPPRFSYMLDYTLQLRILCLRPSQEWQKVRREQHNFLLLSCMHF